LSVLLRGLAFLIVPATLAAVQSGSEKRPEPRRIRVTLLVVLASEKSDRIDPRVRHLADEVRKRNPQLKGFALGSMSQESLAVDQTFAFPLVEGQTAQVVVKKASCPHNRVELAVTAPCQGEIVYRTVCGKFLPIVTRCQTKKGERLILAVQVRPCNGK
jgi:hypothetical protein